MFILTVDPVEPHIPTHTILTLSGIAGTACKPGAIKTTSSDFEQVTFIFKLTISKQVAEQFLYVEIVLSNAIEVSF